LLTHLQATFPEVQNWVWMLNPKANDSYSELPWHVFAGPGYLTEHLEHFQFRISPVSFFQTNSQQALRLYQTVRQLVGPPVQTLYDLYCGTGSIGIFCSALAQRIVGVEYVPQAVADAQLNAQLNHIAQASYHAGDLAKLLNPQFVSTHGHPDVVITDPPRNGMAPEVVQQLLEIAPQRIVYVSCKPSTQARDLALMAHAYEVLHLQPVDMFPQTTHCENVVLLARKP
jgi:23S rRNA (uracil1939-C5)-methyltransferase